MASAKLDLSPLSIDDLLALRDKIEARIQDIAAAEVAALQSKMDALKPYAGKRRKASGPRGKAPAKFKDPATGKTWSGRGMTPVWLREYEEAGKKRSKFAI